MTSRSTTHSRAKHPRFLPSFLSHPRITLKPCLANRLNTAFTSSLTHQPAS